jgi:hypothetical protein
MPPINKNARELLAPRAASKELEGFSYYACVSLAPKGVRAAHVHLGVRVVIVIPLRMDIIIALPD